MCNSGLKAKSTTFAYNNLTRDKNIQILGNQILKRMGRYDAKNKRYKPLIEELKTIPSYHCCGYSNYCIYYKYIFA